MALKNTFTQTPVTTMLNEIQKALIRIGAIGMNYTFDGTGKIIGLSFGLNINGNAVGFTLPIRIEKVREVLRKDNNRRYNDDDYVYRVAWACMRDWVVAQMAMLETEMAEPLQVFLPYAQDKSGKTLFDHVANGKFLLE